MWKTGSVLFMEKYMPGKIILNICLLVFAAVSVFAGIREDADRCYRTAQLLIAKSNDYPAGPRKNECMQKAVKLLDHALELYDRYLEQHPEEIGALEDRITEINANRFWCNRLTTLTFNKSSIPPVEKILQEEGVSLSGEDEGEEDKAPPRPKLEEIMAQSKTPLTKEEARKIAVDRMKRDFLDKISSLVSRRLIANARIQCKRMLRYKETGIPPEFFNQILLELDYVEIFLSSVFDSAMQMNGKKLTLAKTIHNLSVEGVVQKFDKGLLHITMEGKGIEMGIPLFTFDDGFLLRNVSRRTKDVMTGIGAFFLLEGRLDYAKNTFTKIAGMEGEPSNLTPFLDHMKQIEAVQTKVAEKEYDEAAMKFAERSLETALKRMKRKDYDGALKYIHKLYEKADENMDILLSVSNIAYKETDQYLPELVTELVEGCPKCGKTREIECPSCKGAGRYKVRGKYKWCPACKGEAKVPCPYCKKRMEDKSNQKLLTDLRRLFKRDEKPEEPAGNQGVNEGVQQERKKTVDRIPL